MNFQKSDEEVEIMKKAGKICAQALRKVLNEVKIGTSCKKLDIIAQREIENMGASPSFKTVDDYAWTICTTINDQVVHGIPNDTMLHDGDIIGIDIGAFYKGLLIVLAITVPLGKIKKKK